MPSKVHKSVKEFRAAVVAESERLAQLVTKWKKELADDAAKDPRLMSDEIIGDICVATGLLLIFRIFCPKIILRNRICSIF